MSKPIIYLHIGPHKTGTTTIQQNLLANREALARQNFIYPEATRRNLGHHGLGGEINDMPWWTPALGTLEDLKTEVFKARKNVILSSETFSKITTPEPLEKLTSAFDSGFDFKIIPYLRPQTALLSSLWKTEILMNLTEQPFEVWAKNAVAENPNLNYERWLALYADLFGRENVYPQIYKSRNPYHFTSFLKTCGLEPDGFKNQGDGNISYSDYVSEIFYRLFICANPDAETRANKQKAGESPHAEHIFKKITQQDAHIVPQIVARIYHALKAGNIDTRGSVYNGPLWNYVSRTYRPSNDAVAKTYFNQIALFDPQPPARFIGSNPFGRLPKSDVVALANLVFTTYRDLEVNLSKAAST